MIDVILLISIITPFIGYVLEHYSRIGAAYVISVFYCVYGLFSVFLARHYKSYRKIVLSFFLAYVLMAVIRALVGNYLFFSYRDLISNDALTAGCLLAVISSGNITDKTHESTMKLLHILFWISIIVILFQEIVDPLFFTSKKWYVNLIVDRSFSRIQDRLPSIYSFAGPQTAGVGFNAVYGILLSDSLRDRISKRAIIYLATAFVFALLQRSRWVMIFYLIVSAQLFTKHRIRIKYLIIGLLVLVFSSYLLLELGFPLVDIYHERYLDESQGGISEGSWRARTSSYSIFAKYIDEGFFFGIDQSLIKNEVYRDLGRSTDTLLIGILRPMFSYGIVGSFFYYLGLLYLFMELLRYSRKAHDYNYLLTFVAFLVANLSISYLAFNDMGMIIMLIMFNYENRKFSASGALGESLSLNSNMHKE